MPINNITGSPVEGENFYGREKELDFAWNQIKKGNSLILSAPRRVGKSSFAKKMLEFAKKENWNTLEINLEEVKSEEGFIRLFIEKIEAEKWWPKIKNRTGSLRDQIFESIKSIEIFGAKTSIEWKSKKDDIYCKLKKILDHDEDTLIMVDELTILLSCFIKNDKKNGISDVEYFLNWLRSFRQVSGTKIRWIFCSSIGIDNFTNMNNLSYTLNDINSLPIDEFNAKQSKEFLKQLAKSEKLDINDKQAEYILHKLGWNLPYFMQILFSNINQLHKIHDKAISENTIDQAYSSLINEKHLNTWDERLKEYNDYESHARSILKQLSKNKDGVNRNNLYNLLYSGINDPDKTEKYLSKLLYILKNDGYIIDTREAKYVFRSPLLRDFWFNRIVK